jgi:hypothetical protein
MRFNSGVALVTDIYSSANAINYDVQEPDPELLDYNGNQFWKTDILDVDDLPDLD